MGQLVNRVWFTVYCMVPGLYHVRPTQLDFLSSQSEILPGIKGTSEWLSDRAIPQNERSPQNGVISHRYQKVLHWPWYDLAKNCCQFQTQWARVAIRPGMKISHLSAEQPWVQRMELPSGTTFTAKFKPSLDMIGKRWQKSVFQSVLTVQYVFQNFRQVRKELFLFGKNIDPNGSGPTVRGWLVPC